MNVYIHCCYVPFLKELHICYQCSFTYAWLSALESVMHMLEIQSIVLFSHKSLQHSKEKRAYIYNRQVTLFKGKSLIQRGSQILLLYLLNPTKLSGFRKMSLAVISSHCTIIEDSTESACDKVYNSTLAWKGLRSCLGLEWPHLTAPGLEEELKGGNSTHMRSLAKN